MEKCLQTARFRYSNWLGVFLLSIGWLTSFAAPGDIKVEAEDATLTGVTIVSTAPGYSGTGYAWNFDDANDKITFSFSATAGEYDLSIIYHSPYGEKGYGLDVNSVTSNNMFTGTSAGFGSAKPGKFRLNAGQNTVTITNGWGYYGIDYILLTPVATAPPPVVPVVNGRVEAERGVLNGVELATTPAGFSGTGFVTSFDNATDNVVMSFTATAGLYALSVGYTSPFGPKSFDFQVNDERGSGMFAATAATEFSTANAGNFLLKAGLNTITINRGWGYFGIDYVQLTPTTAPIPAKPPKTLVDAQATPSTRSLFSYIVDQYGSKVISGQQNESEINYITEKTGKEAAMLSFDLMDYSPSRIQYGANPTGETEGAIAWAKKNEGRGIVSVMWHWNAPTDLINLPPDRLWWSGFYTRATTFDLAAVLADKNGERYNLLLRDIDAIAVELKKLRDADVPVLWRPLHESPGGWFWWGAKGAEPLKELWRIMHERLTNYHQLHNLIWVYTGTDQLAMNWYPGDQYVDVVGLDIYTDPTANLSGNWNNTLNSFNGKKLVALTEVGNLPKPDNVRGFGTWWSWFAVWTGADYIRKQPIELLQAVYNDVDVITRDELPDWRTYGQVQLTAPDYNCQTGAITFKYTGGDGTPVEFMAVGVKGWSTDPTGFVDAAVREDPKPVQLLARQGGITTSYTFDLPNACAGTTPPPTTGTFSLLAPTYNCATGAITFRTSGGNGSPIEYMAVGIKSWSTDPNGIVEADLRGDPKLITLLARQNGVTVSYGFDLLVACSQTPPTPPTAPASLTMLPPTYNCATGAIVFNTAGGDGNAIEYMAVGIKGWSVNPNGIVEAGLRGDPKVIELMARQSGIIVRYLFDLPNACSAGARRAGAEFAAESLKLTVLGNPVQREVKAEITGAAGQSLRIMLTDLQGRQLQVRQIERAGAVERIVLPIGNQPAGMLLLRAATPTQTRMIKVLKD